jgi:hypothetical protein
MAWCVLDQAVREGQLDARDRPDVDRGAGLGEGHRAVQAVVIRDRQRVIAQLGRAQRQLLGQRGALEERVAGMQVQLGGGQTYIVELTFYTGQASCRQKPAGRE